MKKGDFIIIGAVVFFLAASVLLLPKATGETVTVKKDNKTVYTGSLYKDTTVKLEGNTLIIKDGYAYMENATCKNGVCVHTGRISKKGESIICLPHRVIAEIK